MINTVLLVRIPGTGTRVSTDTYTNTFFNKIALFVSI